MIFLPDSKTGKKPIYLSAAAAEILSALPRVDGNPYVIPGEKTGQPRVDLKRPWDAICEAANLEGVRLHDLRHSFASVGAGASLGLPIIGKLLGHSQPSTTQRYAHLDADPMRRAVETIGSTIAAAMAGKLREAGKGEKEDGLPSRIEPLMAVAPNRLTLNNEGLASGYSGCRRCARRHGGPGRTRGAWRGRLRTGKGGSDGGGVAFGHGRRWRTSVRLERHSHKDRARCLMVVVTMG